MFTPENRLSEDAGFGLWSWQHIIMLAVLMIWCCAVFLWLRKQSVSRQNRYFRIAAGAMVGMEFVKDLILGLIGAFSVGYLPLHLCSLCMLVCLYYGTHPASDFCGQMLYSVCFPAAVSALLFPDWTNFPLLHFQSLHSFVYHALLLQLGLAPVLLGRIKPGVRQVWKPLVFLILTAIPVGGLNRLLHTNYMFLSRPSAGSPLVFLGRLPGRWGYLMGYGVLVLGVLTLLNLPFSLWGLLRNHSRIMDETQQNAEIRNPKRR